jgi:hypothetical protein
MWFRINSAPSLAPSFDFYTTFPFHYCPSFKVVLDNLLKIVLKSTCRHQASGNALPVYNSDILKVPCFPVGLNSASLT